MSSICREPGWKETTSDLWWGKNQGHFPLFCYRMIGPFLGVRDIEAEDALMRFATHSGENSIMIFNQARKMLWSSWVQWWCRGWSSPPISSASLTLPQLLPLSGRAQGVGDFPTLTPYDIMNPWLYPAFLKALRLKVQDCLLNSIHHSLLCSIFSLSQQPGKRNLLKKASTVPYAVAGQAASMWSRGGTNYNHHHHCRQNLCLLISGVRQVVVGDISLKRLAVLCWTADWLGRTLSLTTCKSSELTALSRHFVGAEHSFSDLAWASGLSALPVLPDASSRPINTQCVVAVCKSRSRSRLANHAAAQLSMDHNFFVFHPLPYMDYSFSFLTLHSVENEFVTLNTCNNATRYHLNQTTPQQFSSLQPCLLEELHWWNLAR